MKYLTKLAGIVLSCLAVATQRIYVRKEFSFATNITIFVTVLYKKHNDEKNFILRHICLLITGVNL